MVHAIDQALERRMQERGLRLPARAIYDAEAPGTTLADAVVSLGFYCTASIISDEGLLITNHHCAFSDIAALSTEEHNYLEDGFWAFHRQDEIPLHGKSVSFLRQVLDVTGEVAALKDSLSAAGTPFGSRKLSALMERKYAARTGLKASLHAMWAGEKYYLALYREYTDIRLVGAPPVSVAAFGGDEDNWEWPQHKADFALYRIYDHGEPLQTPWHLKISTAGYREGDFTMVLGFPGRTDRYSSSFKVDYLQQVERPVSNRLRARQMDIVRKWMDADPSVRMNYSNWFFSLSNVQEMQEGESQCVKRFHVADGKRAEERDLAAWVQADPDRTERWGSLLDDLAAEYAAIADIERRKTYFRETLVRGSRIAPTLLRMGNSKGDKMELWQKGLAEVDSRVEKELLTYALEEYASHVGAEFIGTFQDSLLRKFPDKAALVDYLWDHPLELAEFATEVKITAFHAQERPAADLAGLQRDYIRALYGMRASAGRPQYPDANATMRLTYGRVSSLDPRDGVHTRWYSTVRGLFEKHDPQRHDFALPAVFLDALRYPSVPEAVNFLTDNDITGGNSGSPVLDAEGRLIGLAFDGNKESLASDVSYTPSYNKCVCVDIRYILWILRDYVHFDRILVELDAG